MTRPDRPRKDGRPPCRRCRLCGKRYYDYWAKPDRVCRRPACRDLLRDEQAAIARSEDASPPHFSHRQGDIRLSIPYAEKDAFSQITRKTGRRIRKVDGEVERMRARERNRKYRERVSADPDRSRAEKGKKAERWAEYRQRKLAEDPDWGRGRYRKYVAGNPEQMEKARARARVYHRMKKMRGAVVPDQVTVSARDEREVRRLLGGTWLSPDRIASKMGVPVQVVMRIMGECDH